jgi:polyhydroxybutyrate depolymerase
MGIELVLALILVFAALLWLRRLWPAGGRQRIRVNGVWRSYSIHRPSSARGKAPVLLCFHGGLGRVDRLRRQSGIVEAAERQGFVVVFPEAPDGWVDARPERGGSRRDLEFVEALLARLRSSERGKFYALGVSNGGMFVHRLAMEQPKEFEGFATILASIPVAALRGRPAPRPAAPIVLVFGREDRIMPFTGGRIRQGRRPGMGVGGLVASAEETLQYWLRRNFAGGAPTVRRMGGEDGPVEVRDYAPAPTGAPVRFVSIAGWGHKWPRWDGGAERNGAFDISDVIFDFFTMQPGAPTVREAEPVRVRLGGV